MRASSIRIRGKVQGVFFRENAKKMAAELGIAGFVRNEPDGTVYAEVEGEDEVLTKFLEWCREGPEQAEVAEVETKRLPLRDFEGFQVKWQ